MERRTPMGRGEVLAADMVRRWRGSEDSKVSWRMGWNRMNVAVPWTRWRSGRVVQVSRGGGEGRPSRYKTGATGCGSKHSNIPYAAVSEVEVERDDGEGIGLGISNFEKTESRSGAAPRPVLGQALTTDDLVDEEDLEDDEEGEGGEEESYGEAGDYGEYLGDNWTRSHRMISDKTRCIIYWMEAELMGDGEIQRSLPESGPRSESGGYHGHDVAAGRDLTMVRVRICGQAFLLK